MAIHKDLGLVHSTALHTWSAIPAHNEYVMCVHVYVGFYVDSLGEEGAHMMEGYNRMGVGG